MYRNLIILLPALTSGALITIGLEGVRKGSMDPWLGVPLAIVGVVGMALVLSCRPWRRQAYSTISSIPPTRYHHTPLEDLIQKLVEDGNRAVIRGDTDLGARLHESARRLRDSKQR